jgi:dTDP-4-dehydrorhamnose reductase
MIIDKKIIQMKVFVLGSNGMLGRYVYKYLSNYYSTIEVNRDKFDVSECISLKLETILKDLDFSKNDIVINCIGTIKPRVDELGVTNCIITNSLFPHILSDVVDKLGGRVIHPTTDCVYEGEKGNYNEKDPHDIKDIYGRSKSLGENHFSTLIRTSIIGEELFNKRSLVEWVKSNANGKINGFTNHYWNGMTCLEFAKLCKNIIDTENFWKGVKHIYSNTVSKFELLNIINDVYNLKIEITPTVSDSKIDRTLSTVFPNFYEIISLRDQIIEMKNFQI